MATFPLYILPSSEWDDWLPTSVLGRPDAARLVWRAENKMVDRYREDTERAEIEGNVLVDNTKGSVLLENWEEDSDGNADTSQMPNDLVMALRDCVARIATEWHEQADDAGDVRSKSVGSRSVTYRAAAESLPRSVYRPLRKFDDRTPAMM